MAERIARIEQERLSTSTPTLSSSPIFASAEFGCFLELGWPLPENVLDLYVEHRVETNGERTLCGDGLLGALALRGLGHIDAGEKDEMRRLILERQQWSDEERRKILDYCASDVIGTVALFSKMAPSIDWPRATPSRAIYEGRCPYGTNRRSR